MLSFRALTRDRRERPTRTVTCRSSTNAAVNSNSLRGLISWYHRSEGSRGWCCYAFLFSALAFAACLTLLAAPGYGQQSPSEEYAFFRDSAAEPRTTEKDVTLDAYVIPSVGEQRHDEIAPVPAVSVEHAEEVMREISPPRPMAVAAVSSWHLFDEDEEELPGLWAAEPAIEPVDTTSSIPDR